MHSEPHFSDGNILEHKIKALEINSTQFYSQMKPLFTENTQLKQHLISMNYFQEERKIQLCKLINDTGPNGEDRVLTKAVADLKQVCDLIEEEFSRLSQVIILHKNTEEHLSQNVQSLQSKIQSETDHHFKEKQALIDQNRRQSEYYRKLQKEMAMSLNQQVMKNEDLSSQIMELKYRENLKSIKFQKELEEQTQFLRVQIIELTELKNQMQESFEAERRAYLKQLEMMNIKLRQIKEETVDEYEYKLASQRMKLENQITTIKQETTSLRTQLQNSNDKQRTQQAQIDRLNHYIQQLEKEIQEYKYRIFQLEEQLKQKDLNLKSQQSLIDTQKQQLERLRQDFNKKLIEANSYNNGLKRNSTKQIPEKGKLWKQASTLIKREPFSKLIQQNQTKKNADINEHNSLFNSEEKTTQLKSQIIESNQEQLFNENENENENEEQSSNNLQQQQFNDQEQFLSQQSQQSQFSQYENLINSPSQHNSVSPLKSPIKQDQNIITLTDTQTFYVHQVTQTENQNFSEQLEIYSLKPHQDVECQCETDDSTYNEMINQLKRQLNQQIEQHQQRLEEKEIQIQEMEIELVEKEKSFNQQMKIQQQESELIFQEEIDKKDILVSRLQKQIEDLLDRNKGLEENVKQYEELQEEIHQIYEIKLENKDKEINGILEQLNEEKLKGEREQQRLLKLGQEEKMEYQQQLENLMNQHQLDQEQIELEKQRFSKEKSDNKQFKQEAQELFQQVKSKEELLDNYRRELMKSTEIVKYLQLELENYKKINNIFKPKNNDFQVNLVYNGLGFLPIEVQDRIKQKVNKTRHKEMQMKQSQIDGKAYALNFSQQRQIKMKPARLGQMLQNVSMDSKGSDQQLNIKQLIKTETDLPKISTKRLRLDIPFQEQIQNSYQKPDNRMVRSEKKQIKNKNQRSKTQCSDIEDQDLIQDINKREKILIKHSQQLLFSLNSTVQYKPPAVRKRNIK